MATSSDHSLRQYLMTVAELAALLYAVGYIFGCGFFQAR
jgi:hypothetical protein